MEHPPSTERRSMVSCFCASCSWLEWQKAHLQGKKSASLPCRTQPSERAQKSALGLRVLPLSRTEPQLDVFHGALKRSPQWPMCPTVSIYEADVKAHTGTKSHCLTEVSIQGEKSQWPPGVAFQGVHVYGLKKKKVMKNYSTTFYSQWTRCRYHVSTWCAFSSQFSCLAGVLDWGLPRSDSLECPVIGRRILQETPIQF